MDMRGLILTGIVFALFGCEGRAGQAQPLQVCTASVEPGIVVIVRDAVSDKPLAANAVVVITDKDYRETLVPYGYEGQDGASAYSVAGAYERPGVYDINLTLDGYRGWSRTGVKVTAGVCHVGTVTFTARLEKQ